MSFDCSPSPGVTDDGVLVPEGLEEAGIETMIVAGCDMQGRLVGRRLTPATFRRSLDQGVTMTSCVLAWDYAQDLGLEVPYAGLHNGYPDILLRPDPGTLRRAGWLPSTAICLGDFIEVDGGEPVVVAPRTILRRQLERAAATGLEVVIASELETFVYRAGYDDARRADYRALEPITLSRADFTVQGADAMEPFFREVRAALARSGIPIEYCQPETGLGQWEVNLGHREALQMADLHLLFKQALKAVAGRHGLSATFMARPSADEIIGSSGHMHVSLHGSNGPLFFDPDGPEGISSLMQGAIGGVLTHAPDMMLWYAPNVNSYKRTSREDFAGSGGTWGIDNRTTSCRVVGTDPSSKRFEYRVPGADVNPYLATSALVASALDGIEHALDPGPPIAGNAYDQADPAPLPRDLAAAAAAFRASEFAGRSFGEAVVAHYATVAEWEARQYALAVTDWELRRYFEWV